MSEVIVRDYRPSDFETIKAIHEQGGLDYQMPDVNSALFLVKKVLAIDDKVVCAVLWRIEAETYLLLDKAPWGNPEQKLRAIKAVQDDGLNELWSLGIDNCVAWVPKDLEKSFGKRMIALGWKRDREGWMSWSRETVKSTELTGQRETTTKE